MNPSIRAALLRLAALGTDASVPGLATARLSLVNDPNAGLAPTLRRGDFSAGGFGSAGGGGDSPEGPSSPLGPTGPGISTPRPPAPPPPLNEPGFGGTYANPPDKPKAPPDPLTGGGGKPGNPDYYVNPDSPYANKPFNFMNPYSKAITGYDLSAFNNPYLPKRLWYTATPEQRTKIQGGDIAFLRDLNSRALQAMANYNAFHGRPSWGAAPQGVGLTSSAAPAPTVDDQLRRLIAARLAAQHYGSIGRTL